jgi:hypothetical protein
VAVRLLQYSGEQGPFHDLQNAVVQSRLTVAEQILD